MVTLVTCVCRTPITSTPCIEPYGTISSVLIQLKICNFSYINAKNVTTNNRDTLSLGRETKEKSR